MSSLKTVKRVYAHTISMFVEHYTLVGVFSIAFVVALIIPMFLAPPTYIAVGAVFIRSGSFPELTGEQIFLAGFSYLLSIFILSDGLANINLLVRSRRTISKIPQEIIEALGTHAKNIFLVYLFCFLILIILQLISYSLNAQETLYPVLAVILFLTIFFVPSAIVVDSLTPFQALRVSVRMVMKKPLLVGSWIITGLVLLSVAELILLNLPSPYSYYSILLVNALLIVPFLVILQTQMYMERYDIAP